MAPPEGWVEITLIQPELVYMSHGQPVDGRQVWRVQEMLNFLMQYDHGHEQLEEDGILDELTQGQIERFQRKEVLATTGTVNEETWTRLLTLWLKGFPLTFV